MAIKDFIRERFFPHMWCPGCGHGIVLNGMLHAIAGSPTPLGIISNLPRMGLGLPMKAADSAASASSLSAWARLS